jgi:ribosomal protein S18 acetylase RimI-like enzyme
MQIRPFEDVDEDAVVDLWSRCGLLRPWNDPHKDIARKRQVQREFFLVCEIDAELVASAMAGYDGHRGWINYLAVDPLFQRRGVGRLLMEEVQHRLQSLGCSKINLQIRRENVEAIAFYERIGFSEDAVLSFGKRLERDDG